MKRLVRLIASAILAGTALMAWPAEANASVDNLDPGLPGFRIVQSVTGGDTVEFFNIDDVDSSVTSFGRGSSNLGSYRGQRSFFDNVMQSLGANLSLVSYAAEPLDETDNVFPTEVKAHTSQNIFAEADGKYTANVDVAKVARAMDGGDVPEFLVALCPAHVSLTDTSSRSADERSSNCRYWQETTDSTDRLVMTETPTSGAYFHTVWQILLWVAIATAILGAIAALLRATGLKTLGAGTIAISLVMAAFAWVAILSGVIALIATGRTDPYVLANASNGPGQLLAASFPSFLLMIPFLAVVIILVTGRAPANISQPPGSVVNAPTPGHAGVPNWLNPNPGNFGGTQSPAWASPSTPPQQPATTQEWAPPQPSNPPPDSPPSPPPTWQAPS